MPVGEHLFFDSPRFIIIHRPLLGSKKQGEQHTSMPKSAQYTVSWSPQQAKYLFTGPEWEAYLHSLEEGEGWLEWLEEHHAFAFHGRNGQINLLKEKRKRGSAGYWYAYRRHEGQMVKRYVGRSAQLSMERLEEIAARLSNEDETQYLLTSTSQTGHVSVPRSTRGHGKTQRVAGQPISDGNKKAGGTSALPTSAPGESAG